MLNKLKTKKGMKWYGWLAILIIWIKSWFTSGWKN